MQSSRNGAIAAEIRAEMGRRNLTKRRLAVATGLPPSTANRKLNGEVPMDLDDIELFAAALDLDVAELIERAYAVEVVRQPRTGAVTSRYRLFDVASELSSDAVILPFPSRNALARKRRSA